MSSVQRANLWCMGVLCGAVCWGGSPLFAAERPNVVCIITDDQGYGDLSLHGNKQLRTPHLDQIAQEGVQLARFYVSPVCAPTRASLLTGRYNYRTGVVDTYLGRAMMHSDEVTLAEMLGPAGYRCGIFGKWHLGDNFPLRPLDQGFQTALVHGGGGIGQPSDPPGGNHYQDPWLHENGQLVQKQGYCSDVYTDAALQFMQAAKEADEPFFTYLAFNCPHTPLEIAEEKWRPYVDLGLDETTAKVYAMVANIDENVGRVLETLDELKLAENTLVIFLTDNGPQQLRFTAGLRDRKGSVYEGGIRAPCFLRWKGTVPAGKTVEQVAAHIDLMPTILAACGVEPPEGVAFDGRNLWPLVKGETIEWPERTLFFQWHRGDEPQLHRAFAALGARYKLVQAKGVAGGPGEVPAVYELFDLVADPQEQFDLAETEPERVAALKREYETWFAEMQQARGFAPPRIHLGAAAENPVLLTRQDWRGPRAGWAAADLGYWEVEIVAEGAYDLQLLVLPADRERMAEVRIGDRSEVVPVPAGAKEVLVPGLPMKKGPGRLEAEVRDGAEVVGVQYLSVRKLE